MVEGEHTADLTGHCPEVYSFTEQEYQAHQHPFQYLSYDFLSQYLLLIEPQYLNTDWDNVPGMFHQIAKLQAVVVEKSLWEFFVSSRNWEKWRAMDFYNNLRIAISISLVQVSGSQMIENKIYMSIVHIHHGQKQATFLQAASMVKEAMKGQTETLIITQLLQDVDYFPNIAYYVNKSHVTMLHLSRDLSKFASLANNFIVAELIERDTSTGPRSKLVCTKAPLCFVKGGKDYPGNSAIYPFKIWDLWKCSSTGKKKEVTTIQVNVSPVDDTGAGLKKSCHHALVLGKTEWEIASQVGSDPAWIIPGHSTLAFDPLPSEDGASYARSEKKSKKAKKERDLEGNQEGQKDQVIRERQSWDFPASIWRHRYGAKGDTMQCWE